MTFIFFPRRAAQYTAGLPPRQFYRTLDARLLDDYPGVFGVAHNSGDDVQSTRTALDHGADVIEVDVISVGSTLHAAHDRPIPFLGERFFRGPKLDVIWNVARRAEAIKLDLKESSDEYLDLVFEFLRERPRRQVLVATGSTRTLRRFAQRAPGATRLWSIGTHSRFEDLQDDEGVRALIDGVSMKQTLLTPERLTWLERRDLIVLAWVANDSETLNRLVLGGADAITTDNLAILELLGGSSKGEELLSRRGRSEGP